MLGDATYKCEHCGALFWFDERRPKEQKKHPQFSLCCMRGQVRLPILEQPPKFLNDLLENKHAKSRNFIDNIRAYNSMFAFTSMGGKLDKEVNKGKGPYCFKMDGQNVHKIGSLVTNEGKTPKFAQLYIYDIEYEIDNRLNALG